MRASGAAAGTPARHRPGSGPVTPAHRRDAQDWGRFPWLAGWPRRAFFFRRLFEDMRVSLH
ncbi:hypothetical protein BU52_05060 [Streptomyces toyocaensis]|uniref:Uncharacterized protein n=1 Tax=Streptomyces toyocaensis TaxID=55952 RepID=A0A081XXX5_STRTO|nr:hypothetical protein BU52_05060 [Streptomyces toyocaensis]